MNTTPPQIPRKSSGRGCLIGCGIGCLVVALIAAGLVAAAVWFVKDQVKTIRDRFEREGYETVERQIIDVPERLAEPTVFIGQTVKIREGSERGVAILAQTAEIDGEVVGNVHFVGQMLTVHKNAHLKRDLDVKAQLVNLYGVVDGQLTGFYQVLNKTPPPDTP
jgi:uncharacterized membrane protein YhiD involved in acid resistance